MHLPTQPDASRHRPRTELPQYVPGEVCRTCDVCCHFPEADSFLRPYFTEEETAGAIAQGIPERQFTDTSGSQVVLVPHPAGDGYLCPAFNPVESRCTIYEHRPLDCQLYPLGLMWDASNQHVLLGWDTKCPFMVQALPPAIAAHAKHVSALLATEHTIDLIAAHPRLIGRFQEDMVVIQELPGLTARLRSAVDERLRPLVWTDAPYFREAFKRARVLSPDVLAAYAFAYHYMWTSVMPYWWMEAEDTLYLFAQSPDGWFMPLPPLGPRPLALSVADGFGLMRRWNGHSPVSRIENVTQAWKPALEEAGYRVAATGGDYLYHARALAQLAGDQYKSHRALCNRLERQHAVLLRPFRQSDLAGCLALYERWAADKRAGPLDPLGRCFLEDGFGAHRHILAASDRLQLAGIVAVLHDAIVAYTFGYWLTSDTFCVLLEVADRSITGLGQYLFREICRITVAQGAQYINAMDDGGLPGLRDAKRAYRPLKVIDNWIVTGY